MIVVASNEFQLETPGSTTPITLTLTTTNSSGVQVATSGDQLFTPVDAQPIGGLVSGNTYYVINDTGGSFQLANSPPGTPGSTMFISLNATGITGTSTIGVEGIAFTSAGSGTQDLVFPLTPAGASGTYRLVGVGGAGALLNASFVPGLAVANAVSSGGGGVNVGGATATVTSNPTVNTSVGASAILTADVNIAITSTSYANASADGSNSGGGFVGVGSGKATVNVANTNNATVGSGDIINALGNFTLQATASHNVLASSDSTGGGVVDIASATTTVTTDDNAAAQVGASAQITAGGNILIQSSQDVTDSALASTSGAGLGVGSVAAAEDGGGPNDTTNGTTNPPSTTNATTTIQGGANLDAGGNLQILATQGGDTSQADATGKGSAFGVHDVGNAYVTQDYNSNVDVEPGVTLNGPDELQLRADVGTPQDTAIGYGDSSAFAGVTDATAINTVSTDAGVEVAAGSPTTTMRTSQLQVTANNPGPVLTTKAKRTTAFIDFGGSTTTPSQPVNAGTIDFNANVIIAGASAVLIIGSQGQVIQQSGVTFTQTGSQIDVNPINNTLNGTAALTAVSNPVAKGVTGGNTESITGTANFEFDEGIGAVTLTNASTKEFVVSDINVLNTSQQVNVTISPSDHPDFTYTTGLSNSGGTPITITNTSNSDIVLTGIIDNREGTTTVTNTGGNILSSGSGQLIESQLVALTSTSASIGTAADPINVELIEWSFGPPTFSASAALNDYLNLSALNLTSAALILGATELAGQTINLTIEDGEQQQGNTTTTQLSTWNFNGVSTGTQLNANAGNTTAVNLSFTGSGNLLIGSILSVLGDVSLTSTDGAIDNARPGGGSNVTANTITLSAVTATIGAGTALNIDSAHTAAGTVTADAAGSITLDQIAGNLTLNQVQSTGGGTITLTSSVGAIFGSSGPADNVQTSGLADLTAESGIGTELLNLVVNVANLVANAGAGALFIDSIATAALMVSGVPVGGLAGASVYLLAAGALTVSNNVLAPGAVALSAASIDVEDGATVKSTNSSVTLSATGNVTLEPGSFVTVNPATSGIVINGNTIDLYQLQPNMPLLANGVGTNSSLYIPGTAGNDTFNITATAVTLEGVETVSYSNIDTLTVNSLAGNDTFNVTGTVAGLGTYLYGTGSDTLNITANNSANAPVFFTGGSGPNPVFVTGTGSGSDTIVAAPAGDVSRHQPAQRPIRRGRHQRRLAASVRRQHHFVEHHRAGRQFERHPSGVAGPHHGAGQRGQRQHLRGRRPGRHRPR